jgi:hypothetical protein
VLIEWNGVFGINEISKLSGIRGKQMTMPKNHKYNCNGILKKVIRRRPSSNSLKIKQGFYGRKSDLLILNVLI